MGRRLAVVLAVIGVVVALVIARRRRAESAGATQATGVDYRMSALSSAFDAPDGGTPCETAFNAFQAIDAAAKKGAGMTTPWKEFPDRPTFLARCGALPPQEQLCMMPRYVAQNHGVCDPIQQGYDKKNPLWD